MSKLSKKFEKEKLIVELVDNANKDTITGMAILNAITGRKFTDE